MRSRSAPLARIPERVVRVAARVIRTTDRSRRRDPTPLPRRRRVKGSQPHSTCQKGEHSRPLPSGTSARTGAGLREIRRSGTEIGGRHARARYIDRSTSSLARYGTRMRACNLCTYRGVYVRGVHACSLSLRSTARARIRAHTSRYSRIHMYEYHSPHAANGRHSRCRRRPTPRHSARDEDARRAFAGTRDSRHRYFPAVLSPIGVENPGDVRSAPILIASGSCVRS